VQTATIGADTGARRGGSDVTPVYSPEEELTRFRTQPGYRLELVAAEPLVQDPVAIDFDPDGRMYVAEMRSFMPNLAGTGEDRPIGRIVVLEDTNDDGRMDKKTVFLDSLVLPRSVKVLSQGVLVAETPNLWLARDTNGDGKADTKTLVRDDYGTKQSNPSTTRTACCGGSTTGSTTRTTRSSSASARTGAFSRARRRARDSGESRATSTGGCTATATRIHCAPSSCRRTTRCGARTSPTRAASTSRSRRTWPVWPGHKTPAVNRGYREQTLRPADSTLAHYTVAGARSRKSGDRLPAELRRACSSPNLRAISWVGS
jgi:putative membrane-bound dehydrogenase-like protein